MDVAVLIFQESHDDIFSECVRDFLKWHDCGRSRQYSLVSNRHYIGDVFYPLSAVFKSLIIFAYIGR